MQQKVLFGGIFHQSIISSETCSPFHISNRFHFSAQQRIQEGKEVWLKHLLPVLPEADPGVQGGLRHHRQRQGWHHHCPRPKKGLWGKRLKKYQMWQGWLIKGAHFTSVFCMTIDLVLPDYMETMVCLLCQRKSHFLGHLLAPLLDKGTKSNGTMSCGNWDNPIIGSSPTSTVICPSQF